MELSDLVCKDEILKKDYPKYGLCAFSESCELYTPHDNECNRNRGPFIKPDNPHCYIQKANLKV